MVLIIKYFLQYFPRYSSINYYANTYTFKNSMIMCNTNEQETYNKIMQLRHKRSPGSAGIRSETLKIISNEIKNPLTFLINKSFKNGCLMHIFKIGIIKPLKK